MSSTLVCLPGAELELLVLAAGHRVCAAVDLESGALVQAHWPDPIQPLPPMALARARIGEGGQRVDPIRPEAVPLSRPPAPTGQMPRRRAERWLRPLLHPVDDHLFGLPGPTIPYWSLSGDRPSVALVAPATQPILVGNRCRFVWCRLRHELPVLPTARASAPPRPGRLVITLSAPRDGHCYKVVAGLLPG